MAHQSSLVTRISATSITVILDGKVRTLNSKAPNFPRLDQALKDGKANGYDLDLIRDLVDISSFIARETHGAVTISDNQVRYKGEKQTGLLADRILQHLAGGYSVAPLALFMDKLMSNPNVDVREDLFAWLESGDMPIAEDGDIIAFKKVQNDYYSYHSGRSGKVLHQMGTVVEIPRSEVDPNRRNECSTGLHFCSYGYLSNYYGGNGRVLMVKINPADVVAIPTDYGRQKGRTFRMFVYDEIAETEAKAALSGKLVAPKTGLIEQEKTARISSVDDNLLGDDNEGNPITGGRLRGLLAHGGIEYAAKNLGVSVERVDALAEMIDFKRENLGVLPSEKAPEPRRLEVVNNPEIEAFIAAFGGSIAHASKARDAAKAGNSAHAALFSDPATADIVRNILNAETFDTKVRDIFGISPVASTSQVQIAGKTTLTKVKDEPKKAKKASTGLSFTHGDTSYTAKKVEAEVGKLGQRGFSTKYGVPRSTLQNWLKKISQS